MKPTTVIFDMYETLVTQYKSKQVFGKDMSEDLGIPLEKFYSEWQRTEEERSIGKMSLEEALTKNMLCYRNENGTQELTSKDKALIDYIARKRLTCKLRQFQHLHEGIVPMLSKLIEEVFKKLGISYDE